ncbi:MAG TPA: hypothetical protein VE136_00825 [Anaerolineales bacterium]|jgi:hypothetical protein|nr:hypothetical protein [Anaerolineales bacterium]
MAQISRRLFHAGEYFKSVFDQYRQEINFDDVVKWVAEIKGDEALLETKAEETQRQRFEAAWRYLQFYMIKLNEGPPIPVPEAKEKQHGKGTKKDPLRTPEIPNTTRNHQSE